jgi:hypothetical protein
LPKVEDMSELLGFDLPATVGEPAPQSPLPFDHHDSALTPTDEEPSRTTADQEQVH